MTHPAHAAVGELIRTQTLRIDITADTHYTVRAPCLLQQLADAIATGTETGGRGVPGSRPPIALDAWDLWRHITTNTHTWAEHLGLNRRNYLQPPTSRDHIGTPPIGQLLRSCATTATSTGKTHIADAIHAAAEQWRRQISTLLTGQAEQRGVRGARCPDLYCQAYTVTEPRDGETYRIPAVVLIVQTHDGLVLRWLACRACGWCGHVDDDGTVTAVSLDPTPDHAA